MSTLVDFLGAINMVALYLFGVGMVAGFLPTSTQQRRWLQLMLHPLDLLCFLGFAMAQVVRGGR